MSPMGNAGGEMGIVRKEHLLRIVFYGKRGGRLTKIKEFLKYLYAPDKKQISLELSEELIELVDACKGVMSRNAYITGAIYEQLKQDIKE